jgi:hypothetical protein
MAPKLTGSQLLAQMKQTQEDTAVFKAYWQDSLPPGLPLPLDHEIKNAVRRLALADLATGIQAYLVIIAKGKAEINTRNAMDYVCGTAWKIREQENADQKFHPTARRIRNAQRDPDSSEWDGGAFHDATPEERQRIMAEVTARQKARKVQ